MRFRVIVVLLALTTAVSARQTPAVPPQVVATIDGEPVLAAEALREFEQAYGKSKISDEQKPQLLERALAQVIDRRLALRRLVALGQAASQADVEQAFSRLQKQLADQNIQPEEHYERIGMTQGQVRQNLLWTLSWQKYLAAQLTDENLARYFEQHRTDFDGTQLKVKHILLPSEAGDAAGRQAALAKAAEIRTQIAAGKLTFSGAAKMHSSGPSAKLGGDLGWIERHQPMPEPFSAAAFALELGEVSQPVTTTFGIHLLQVIEAKAGERTWQDAAGELRPAMTVHLFRWLADKERMSAKVVRVGKWP